MANKRRDVYKAKPMTEGKKAVIQGLLNEYDIQTAEDIQDAFKDLLKPVLKGIVDSTLHKGKCDEKYGDFKIDFAYGIAERLAGDKVGDVVGKADKLMYEHKNKVKQGTPVS
ncbi:hypothetical protein [Butyrivibrio sp. MB2005]|uniref:hypothetical protein n=1 Tax=Butyrivibrio sp. MB2005 TaxID=1280678 RepID=UPI0004217813|nr:hypothetical protein [Butyrivibrio sp. MB2005]